MSNIPYYPHKDTFTRAFLLEIDKDIATNHSESIFTLLGADSDLTLVPINSDMDMDNKIQQYFFCQNEMLKKATFLLVDNIYNLNKKLELTDGTTNQSLLKILSQPDQDGKSLFHNITQFNSKHVNFLCSKDKEMHAINVLNMFLFQYLPTLITQESRENISVHGKPFVVHDTQQILHQILIFVQTAKKKPIPEFDDTFVSSVYSNPPKTARQTYATALQASSERLTMAQSTTTDLNVSTRIDDLLKSSAKKIQKLRKKIKQPQK